MPATSTAKYDFDANVAIVRCSVCGEVRLAGKYLDGRRPLESALDLHRTGSAAAAIDACRDPGEPLSNESEHIANFILQHHGCGVTKLQLAARYHGPFDGSAAEFGQEFRCGNDTFELSVRRVAGEKKFQSDRADVAVYDDARRTLYCLLCTNEQTATIARDVTDPNVLADIVQTHITGRHRKVESYTRRDTDNLGFWLAP